MRRRQVSAQTHPICYPLDQTAGAGIKAVVLETMHQFMHQHPADLSFQPIRRDARYVVETEMDLLSSALSLRADRVRYPVHGPQDQEEGEDGGDVGGEVFGDVGGGEEGGGAG
ncbi:hypothetical protein V500_10024, partial [Pseudogymnoascus sp. VKM F-4518 (FW-2643)]